MAAEAEAKDEQDEEAAAIPLYVPSCLSAPIVGLLTKQGVEAATKYKDHFNLRSVAPSEMQIPLA